MTAPRKKSSVALRRESAYVEVELYLSASDSAAVLLVLTSVTPPRLSEPPGLGSLEVVAPMDFNRLLYL